MTLSETAVEMWPRPARAGFPSSIAEAAGLREPGDYRRALYQGALADVVDISVSPYRPPPSGYSASYQIVLPYLGLFGCRIGRRSSLVDANRTVFVAADEEFADTHPVPGLGHACLVIAPAPATLEDLFGSIRPGDCAEFRNVCVPAGPRLRLLTQSLRDLLPGDRDCLRSDELIMAALREAAPSRRRAVSPRGSRAIDRAKQLLHAGGFEPVSLTRIARSVGVSPVYLTQEFTRSEGQPLYRYQMNLRLSRALVELPHSDSLTTLALDLGFSSHSHFSSAFKAAYGVTPSRYRAGARRRV